MKTKISGKILKAPNKTRTTTKTSTKHTTQGKQRRKWPLITQGKRRHKWPLMSHYKQWSPEDSGPTPFRDQSGWKNCQPIILYLIKIPFRKHGEIKIYLYKNTENLLLDELNFKMCFFRLKGNYTGWKLGFSGKNDEHQKQ